MTRIVIEVKKTVELNEEVIKKINALKNQYWKYSDIEHMRWFKNNIRDNDMHLMIFEESALIAYLNIVHVNAIINQTAFSLLGIGNVCVDKRKSYSGIGTIMMSVVNALIKCLGASGVLLCRGRLKLFYRKNKWKCFRVSSIILGKELCKLDVLFYDPNHLIPKNVGDLSFDKAF